MGHTNEIDLVIKYANQKGGGDGQLILDSVELNESRDNRVRHGIGNEDPQEIERGNKTYTFSTTAHMNDAAAKTIKRLRNGNAETDAVYIRDEGTFKGKSSGLVFNDLSVSSSDDGDTTVEIDADLPGIDWTYPSDYEDSDE